jgi:hypothetical protein
VLAETKEPIVGEGSDTAPPAAPSLLIDREQQFPSNIGDERRLGFRGVAVEGPSRACLTLIIVFLR